MDATPAPSSESTQRPAPTMRDLVDFTQFANETSATIRDLRDEADIYATVVQRLSQSRHYGATVLLFDEDATKLTVAAAIAARSRGFIPFSAHPIPCHVSLEVAGRSSMRTALFECTLLPVAILNT